MIEDFRWAKRLALDTVRWAAILINRPDVDVDQTEPSPGSCLSTATGCRLADPVNFVVPLYQKIRVPLRHARDSRLTGIGRSKLYELIKAGDIEIIKVGSMTLVPMVSLKTFLDGHRQTSPAL